MPTEVRKIEPLAADWQRFSWSSGTFDTARRAGTREVAGVICVPHHLVLVTLSGGARQLAVQAECGHRYAGNDFAGSVSFVPAGCGRRLEMRDVQAAWASISLRPDLLDPVRDIPTFTNVRDPLVSGLLSEFARLHARDELDAAYGETMSHALALHLGRKYGARQPAAPAARRLPAWRMRRIVDYVEAHMDRQISVAELAELVGLSVGHFHRTLRATTGQSPLELMSARRMERARQRLLEGAAIAALSLELGFASPSHFARVFRRDTGVSPAVFRSGRSRERRS